MSHFSSRISPARSKIVIFVRRIDRDRSRNAGGENASLRFGFTAVMSRHSIGLPRIRIGGHDFAGGVRIASDLRNEFGGEKSFAVILENDRVELRQALFESAAITFAICVGRRRRESFRDRPARPVGAAR